MIKSLIRMICLAILIVFISPYNLLSQNKPRITKYETPAFL